MAGVAKVTLNGDTLIDVTDDTVDAGSMLSGKTALTKTGDRAIGTISGTSSATTGISISNHGTTSIYGVGSTTNSIYGVQSTTTTASSVTMGTAFTVPNVTAAGSGSFGATVTNHVLSFSHAHTAPTLGTSFTIPNVSSVSSVTVPIKNTASTAVPIKNTTSTTVVTGSTHTITDNGHTHSIG